MRTAQDIDHAFSPVPRANLTPSVIQRIDKVGAACKDLANELLDLVPECADRTAAIRKLLEVKWTATQAVTHFKDHAPTTTHTEMNNALKKT